MSEENWDLVLDEKRVEMQASTFTGPKGVALNAATAAGFGIVGWAGLSGVDPVSAVLSSLVIAIPVTSLILSLPGLLTDSGWIERALRRTLRPGWIRWTVAYSAAAGGLCGGIAVALLAAVGPEGLAARALPWLVPATAVAFVAAFSTLRIAFVGRLKRSLRIEPPRGATDG